MKEDQLSDGSTVRRCIYTPHSLRATTATLLLDGNVDIVKVKDLLGHRHITTTQIYDKRRRIDLGERQPFIGDLITTRRPAHHPALRPKITRNIVEQPDEVRYLYGGAAEIVEA
jgi:hypothetical protein